MSAGLNIADFLLAFVTGVGAPAENAVIDKTHTSERLGQKLNLIGGWIKPVFVCAFHGLMKYAQKCERF